MARMRGPPPAGRGVAGLGELPGQLVPVNAGRCPSSTPQEPALAQPTPGRPAVLVVDDCPAVCLTLGAWLRAHGLVVWLAGGGPQAVELLRLCGADLAVLEVYLRGWDGPRTLAAL